MNISFYCWIGGNHSSDVGEETLRQKNLGFNEIKMNATEEIHYIDNFSKIEAVCDRVGAVRENCGNHFGIAVDFYGRVHKTMAKEFARQLDKYNLMFVEELVL